MAVSAGWLAPKLVKVKGSPVVAQVKSEGTALSWAAIQNEGHLAIIIIRTNQIYISYYLYKILSNSYYIIFLVNHQSVDV